MQRSKTLFIKLISNRTTISFVMTQLFVTVEYLSTSCNLLTSTSESPAAKSCRKKCTCCRHCWNDDTNQCDVQEMGSLSLAPPNSFQFFFFLKSKSGRHHTVCMLHPKLPRQKKNYPLYKKNILHFNCR